MVPYLVGKRWLAQRSFSASSSLGGHSRRCSRSSLSNFQPTAYGLSSLRRLDASLSPMARSYPRVVTLALSLLSTTPNKEQWPNVSAANGALEASSGHLCTAKLPTWEGQPPARRSLHVNTRPSRQHALPFAGSRRSGELIG